MARAFILSPKHSDAGAITASTSVSNAVAVNMLRARPRLYWRSTDATPYVEENLGSARVLDTLTLGYVNATADDTFRLRLASSQGALTSSPGYDSNDSYPSGVPLWPEGSDLSAYSKIHRVFTFPSQTLQWVRIDYAFSSNPLGYVQVSRSIIGARVEPVSSVQSKWSIGGEEPVAETIDMGGEESSRAMGTKRSITATWHNLTEAERESLYTTLLERGSSKDIVLAIEPSEGVYSMSRVYIGRVKHMFSFEQTMRVDSSDDGQRFTVSLTVSELAPVEMV